MPLPRLEPGTSGKRWVSVANWATPVGYIHNIYEDYIFCYICSILTRDNNRIVK
ncbi:hypothetical protein Hanom_Chr04g00385301 [Helianthus anomalus]